MNNILILLYDDPLGYPPTLNAIQVLGGKYNKVTVIARHYMDNSGWNYPKNVEIIWNNELTPVREIERLPLKAKIVMFFKYLQNIKNTLRNEKFDVVLCYDNIPLFAYWLVTKLLRSKPILWYHNHDVLNIEECRKYSIQWFAGYFEPKIFKSIDIFSLPANARKQFFKIKNLKGKYFFVPNFPATSFYNQFYTPKTNNEKEVLKMIYQGRLSEGHGFEEIIPILSQKINGKSLQLNLIGIIDEPYKNKLLDLAKAQKVSANFQILPPVAYQELPKITASHHIGLAIHKPFNVVYSTGGTASNKIYEYAALGLPVLLYNNEHYTDILGKYNWAFFTDLTTLSLIENLQQIEANHSKLQKIARTDFLNSLNFKTHFSAVLDYIEEKNA